MIICNKCGLEISEQEEKSILDENKDETGERKGRGRKESVREELPLRRPSLIRMPYKYELNVYVSKDVDLCDSCLAILNKRLDATRLEFFTEVSE